MSSPPRRTPSDLHTFATLDIPLAPRSQHKPSPIRFAAPEGPFLPASVQRRLSQRLLVRFATPIDPFLPVSRQRRLSQRLSVRFAGPGHLLPCSRSSASARPRFAKPTTAPSHPLRCTRRYVSACFRAATPIPASSRPLRYYGARHCMKHREAPSRIRIFGCKSGNYRLSKAQRP